jgi:hypothetical protein
VERRIYREMREEADGFDWEVALLLLERYLRKCNLIGYLCYLKHRAR